MARASEWGLDARLLNLERDLPLIMFITRPCDLVFVDQVRCINSNPLDNRKLMRFVPLYLLPDIRFFEPLMNLYHSISSSFREDKSK